MAELVISDISMEILEILFNHKSEEINITKLSGMLKNPHTYKTLLSHLEGLEERRLITRTQKEGVAGRNSLLSITELGIDEIEWEKYIRIIKNVLVWKDTKKRLKLLEELREAVKPILLKYIKGGEP